MKDRQSTERGNQIEVVASNILDQIDRIRDDHFGKKKVRDSVVTQTTFGASFELDGKRQQVHFTPFWNPKAKSFRGVGYLMDITNLDTSVGIFERPEFQITYGGISKISYKRSEEAAEKDFVAGRRGKYAIVVARANLSEIKHIEHVLEAYEQSPKELVFTGSVKT